MTAGTARRGIRAKSIAKRRRIMDATAKLIAQKGSEDITLQEVADKVGMYAASIYYYFDSREDLLRQVHIASLERMRSIILAGIDALPDDCTALDRLREAMRSTINLNSSADDYALAYTKVLNKASAFEDREIRESRKAIRETWLELLRDAQRSGQIRPDLDLKMVRSFMVGAMHWVAYWYRADGPATTVEIADGFFDLLIEGAGRSKGIAADDRRAGSGRRGQPDC